MSRLTNFGVALGVSIILVTIFSILPDGEPSEAASIIIQAFWLIAVLIRIILSVIVVFLVMIIFVVLSFIISGLNFFIEAMGQGKISTTFLLDMQENALLGVDGFYYMIIDFLVGFKESVEQSSGVVILWNPNQTLGGGISVISDSAVKIVDDIIHAGQQLVDDIVEGLGGLIGGNRPN